MNILLWTITVVVSVIFAASGVMKSTLSRDRLLASGQTGIGPFPMPLVRAVAVCELAAVVGLIVPWLTDVARFLTPIAALGLVAVMYGAAVSHASLREPKQTAVVLGILCTCAFLAAARFAQL